MRFRQWLPNVLLALAVAAIVLTFPVLASAQNGCTSLQAASPIIERVPVFRVFSGEKLAIAVEVFNSFPPESETEWTSAYLMVLPDRSGFLMVGMDSTICGTVSLDPGDVEMILQIIDGQPV